MDVSKPIGTISKYLFGQNVEPEHGAISGGEQNMNLEHGFHTGGLWAEMLRDRKFEEGLLDGDGVANGWIPEERVANRYEELVDGRAPNHRYWIEYYGGGAAQAMEIYGDGSNHASVRIACTDLHFPFSAAQPQACHNRVPRRVPDWLDAAGSREAPDRS